jgi:hypothetical protein
MSYGSSTMQAFTEALQTNLLARLAAANEPTRVFDGPPPPGGGGYDQPEWIMLGDVVGAQHPPAISSRQPREEDYDLHVMVSVTAQTASDQKTVNDRAFTLLDYLNQELRGNLTQGVAGVYAATIAGGFRQSKRANAKARECCLEVLVHVLARI